LKCVGVRVCLAQLLQQLRKMFWAKLCQRVLQNSFTGEAVGRHALWSSLGRAKLQKGSFPRFALPFAKAAPGWGLRGGDGARARPAWEQMGKKGGEEAVGVGAYGEDRWGGDREKMSKTGDGAGRRALRRLPPWPAGELRPSRLHGCWGARRRRA
jgi:hypothetical protein